MKKILCVALCALFTISVFAEGYESMTNIPKQTYEWDDVTNYTGDNGKPWKAVGAQDSKVGGYKALAVHSSVSGNGLSGQLTDQQIAEGVGTVSFMVKGAEAGTGYGDRTFRVTAGSKSVTVTVKVPSMSASYQFDAKVDATGASTLAITMLESVSGETASFYIYNVTWTSFSGKTDSPEFACDASYVAEGTDTTYYTADKVTVRLSCPMTGAKIFYTTDGTTPTQSSTQGNSLTLGIGTHTVKALAYTAEAGESEVATKVFKVAKGAIVQYDANDENLPGEYGTISASTLKYTTLSGQPFYQLNAQKNHIITDAAVHPYGLSCYAFSANRTLTVAWQAGTLTKENDVETFNPTTDWTDFQTISNFGITMDRYEILVPAAAKDKTVRFRITASGTSVYVDDIVLIAGEVKHAEEPEPIIEPVHPASVTLSQTEATLEIGETVTLTATVLPADAENKNVSWSSSDAYVASVVGGVVTALHAGTTTITVTTEDGGLTDQCVITVNEPYIEPVHPASVTLSETSLTIENGTQVTLVATVLPADAENKEVTWTSSDTNVASVENGVVTALHKGTTTITVTTIDGGLTDQCVITVTKGQGIVDVETECATRKILHNGQILIIRNDSAYTIDGRRLQ